MSESVPASTGELFGSKPTGIDVLLKKSRDAESIHDLETDTQVLSDGMAVPSEPMQNFVEVMSPSLPSDCARSDVGLSSSSSALMAGFGPWKSMAFSWNWECIKLVGNWFLGWSFQPVFFLTRMISNPVDDLLKIELKRPIGIMETLPRLDFIDGQAQLSPPKKRVVATFHEVVKHGTEMTWKKPRNAQWETAIRRWHSLILSWRGELNIAQAIHQRSGFRAQAQIKVDIFYNKAPATLLKRGNSLARFANKLQHDRVSFPWSESYLYGYMCAERKEGCSSSRLVSLLEPLSNARHVSNVLGVAQVEERIKCRRCHGAAHPAVPKPLKQAPLLTVKHLRMIHEGLENGTEDWGKLFCGMVLFCTYARARWPEAHAAFWRIHCWQRYRWQFAVHWMCVQSATDS